MLDSELYNLPVTIICPSNGLCFTFDVRRDEIHLLHPLFGGQRNDKEKEMLGCKGLKAGLKLH